MVMTILRVIAGVVIGVALGFGVVMAGDALHHQLFPIPEGINPTRPDDLARLSQEWPWQAFATMVASWGLAAFIAGAAAGLIAGRGRLPAWIAAGLLGAATTLNLILVPHPVWVWPAAAAALLLGIWAAGAVTRRRAATQAG